MPMLASKNKREVIGSDRGGGGRGASGIMQFRKIKCFYNRHNLRDVLVMLSNKTKDTIYLKRAIANRCFPVAFFLSPSKQITSTLHSTWNFNFHWLPSGIKFSASWTSKDQNSKFLAAFKFEVAGEYLAEISRASITFMRKNIFFCHAAEILLVLANTGHLHSFRMKTMNSWEPSSYGGRFIRFKSAGLPELWSLCPKEIIGSENKILVIGCRLLTFKQHQLLKLF